MSETRVWQHWSKGRYSVTTDPGSLDFDTVHGFLRSTTWASGQSREVLSRAVAHSLCFSLFEDQRQIGFSRVITDYATYAYLCDVYVAESSRGQGLGRWMVQCVLDHAVVGRLKRVTLLTHGAEAFYRELNFDAARHGSIYLERLHSAF